MASKSDESDHSWLDSPQQKMDPELNVKDDGGVDNVSDSTEAVDPSLYSFSMKGTTIAGGGGKKLLVTFTKHEISIGWPLTLLPGQILRDFGATEDVQNMSEDLVLPSLMTMLFAPKYITLYNISAGKAEELPCGETGMSDGYAPYMCLRDKSHLVTGFKTQAIGAKTQPGESIQFNILRLNHVSGYLKCSKQESGSGEVTAAHERYVKGFCDNYENYVMFTYELGAINSSDYQIETCDIFFQVNWYASFYQDGSAQQTEHEKSHYISQYGYSVISDLLEALNPGREKVVAPKRKILEEKWKKLDDVYRKELAEGKKPNPVKVEKIDEPTQEIQQITFPVFCCSSQRVTELEFYVDYNINSGEFVLKTKTPGVELAAGNYIIDVKIDVEGNKSKAKMTLKLDGQELFSGALMKHAFTVEAHLNGPASTPVLTAEGFKSEVVVKSVTMRAYFMD